MKVGDDTSSCSEVLSSNTSMEQRDSRAFLCSSNSHDCHARLAFEA